jgi:hypothetical protein
MEKQNINAYDTFIKVKERPFTEGSRELACARAFHL